MKDDVVANGAANGKGTLVERAMAAVRDHIRENGLKVGDTLPGEGRFAADLQVSRAVMREAFGGLAALRQIDVANGRRARVAAIDGTVLAQSLDHAVATAQASVVDVWEVRRTLELGAVELAARNRTEAQAQKIVAAAQAMVEASGDLRRLSAADVAFHHAVAQASGNPLFHKVVQAFHQLMDITVPRAWQTRPAPERRAEILELHQQVARAIADRDAATAVDLMERHFEASIAELLKAAGRGSSL